MNKKWQNNNHHLLTDWKVTGNTLMPYDMIFFLQYSTKKKLPTENPPANAFISVSVDNSRPYSRTWKKREKHEDNWNFL